ncbi:MAG: hypothetical protein K2G32_02370, partial [Oscillospiraceae bacterium]|nr:hypothetical protein [Oscillospiraceae bacterium]
MKKVKSLLATALSAAMVLALVGCEDSEPIQSSQPENSIASTTPATTPDPDENAATDEKAKVISSEDYTPDGNAGKVKYLGHY